MAGVVAGKTAIVTGAGRGIGRGIAMLLASEGARVVVCDIGASLQGEGSDTAPAQDTVNAIKRAGGEAIASTMSITEPKNAEAIVKSAFEAFGRVDILVNNAGILRDVIFHKMSWSDWSDVIAVHLNGSFNMSRAVAPLFREQNSGAFVHMTSTSGLVGNFGQANYMAAKLGIMGLSRGIALDMARFNVRSNCIAPFALTRMIESIPAQSEQDKRRIEAFQGMTPEKIAPLAVFLCSDAATGITGQIFSVRNNEIYLFSQPRPVKTIRRADGWTPEQIAAELNPAFASLFTPLERSEDVFNWDPI
jgi:NAD(P)-dependent dehydrogenase (short-subunit alcohol dehydrogenase family)